jgi:hypothetical protein
MNDALYTAQVLKIVARPDMSVHHFDMASLLPRAKTKSGELLHFHLNDFLNAVLDNHVGHEHDISGPHVSPSDYCCQGAS